MKGFFSMNVWCGLLLGWFLPMTAAAQVQITLGPDEIGENQTWTIAITVQNDRLKNYDKFPDIEGFRQRGTSTQNTTSVINGQVSSSQSIIMNYTPTRQGTFTIPSFSMKVNDKIIPVTGKKVKVGPAVQQRDPFASFFNRPNDFAERGEPEFVDIKEDAFLALSTSKDQVYVGEGFNATLAFYVAEANRAPMQFYDLSRQLSEILKKLKPTNCWEENFNIENIEAERVTINGKDYSQYKIYQATYYPLNTNPIQFPSVGLEMIKYKIAKNPSYFGQNRLEDFKTFYSKAKQVTVKELPPHPLRDVVAVGNYRLDERTASTDLKTGQSGAYEFNIVGEGNIAGIEKPIVNRDGNFEIYEPNLQQSINHDNNRVTGSKSFKYFIIPREPGQYKLGDYFKWIYFNPQLKKYDTLRSKLNVYVTGESKQNEAVLANDGGSFYDKIDTTDNQLRTIADTRWQKWALNGVAVLLLGAAIFFLFKKQRAY